MAIQLEANYSKKIGLPGYSSHQFSITLKTELNDISQIDAESSRLYRLLQSSVDQELQQQGYVPVNGNGQFGKSPQNGKSYHRSRDAGSDATSLRPLKRPEQPCITGFRDGSSRKHLINHGQITPRR